MIWFIDCGIDNKIARHNLKDVLQGINGIVNYEIGYFNTSPEVIKLIG